MTTESKKSPAPEQASEARRSAETAAVGAVTAEAIVEQPEGTGNETSSKFSDGKSRADALTGLLNSIVTNLNAGLPGIALTRAETALELLAASPVEQPAAAPADERTTTFDEWLERYVTETGGRVFPPDALRACWHASAAAANDTGAEGAEPQPSFDERKEFEAWARDQGYSIYGDPRVRDAYGGATQSAWRGWMGRSRLTDGRAVTLLRQARDELSNIEWENDPPDRIYALFGDIDKYVSGSPAMAAAAPADERAAFEAWARPDSVQQKHDASGEYAEPGMSAAWAGWQARAAASPAAEAHAEIVSKMERLISAVNAYTGIGSWYAKQIQDLCSSLLMTLAAPQPAQADALNEEQRDALNEAICWANDDGLPGTADQLRSILALHSQADAPAPDEVTDKRFQAILHHCRLYLDDESGKYNARAVLTRIFSIAASSEVPEQADAPAEALEPVCKLCRSTGPDLPCVYPTEINRQQAKRIAELESRLSVNVDPHPDDVAVDVFAAVMKDKLAKARLKGRGGWQTCSPENLSRMLREHVEKGDPRDVANFCMMLWHHGSPIVYAPADAGSGDAISRSKRILALVDDYHEKPTADSRTALRKALMDEFETAPPTARVESLTNEQIAATARQHATSFVDGDDAITDLFFEGDSYLEFARALLAPTQQPSGEATGWQPIETAPKDGTAILGWNADYEARQTHWAFYGEGSIAKAEFDAGKGESGSWYWHEPQSHWLSGWKPTHWMPMPDTPADAARAQGGDHANG
ncbi:hypothetical protein WJ85_08000 [Burkholderia ubonensis]|uniref:hypothetical protein n=1 Tax=Burkholderia ubonensis TaxID=101571 RepID=UPI000759B721|nr:hypothetical protein [Burkholderia ubonensis]KVP19420.1 hypothetical protein WJ85_08000 [Burkholderia ubonensis]